MHLTVQKYNEEDQTLDISATANELIAARKSDTIMQIEEFPKNLADAYAIQRAVAKDYGEALTGWKAAFTAAPAMEMMKTDEPAYGPLFEGSTFISGDTLKSPDHCLRRIECEYAFKIAADFGPRDEEYSLDEIISGVASLHPAIEVVHVRVNGAFDIGARAVVADHCGNYAFVAGAGTSEWHSLDIINQPVTLSVNDEQAATGGGKNVLGNPLKSLVWIINRLCVDGYTVAEGQYVTTGSCTGMHPVPQSCELIADFGPLGQCELNCKAQ